MSAAEPPPARAKLWDGPTRLFHWSLVVLILVAWLSAGEQMAVHKIAGYAVIGLVVFRVYWGLVGSSTARFSSFVRGPATVAKYVSTLGRRDTDKHAGHNPLGGLSVMALILLILVQAGLGLFAVDIDGIESGPLSNYVDFDTGRALAEAHELTFRLLQGLVVLHLIAIGYYLIWKRQNLIGAMITGWQTFSKPPAGLRFAPVWRVVIGVLIAAGVAYLISRGLKLPRF